MTKNYFSVERSNKCVDNVCFQNNDGSIAFEEVMTMSCNEIKTYNNIDAFVVATMNAANKCFGEDDDQTLLTLIGEDGVFIWSIIIDAGEEPDEFKYLFIDWKKDGNQYRYDNLST